MITQKTVLKNIHEKKPLIHCITNYVTANDCANILLAIGASPIMSSERREMKKIQAMADGLYVNIGTLKNNERRAVKCAIKAAIKKGNVIVIDPVGSGATPYRTKMTNKILKWALKGRGVIKGNASEIKSLFSQSNTVGVDASEKDQVSYEEAKSLSKKWNKTIVITGKTDTVCSGETTRKNQAGTEIFKKITGAGCMLGAVIAACAASTKKEAADVAKIATEITGKAGQKAEKSSGRNPGTFRAIFFDEIYRIANEKSV